MRISCLDINYVNFLAHTKKVKNNNQNFSNENQNDTLNSILKEIRAEDKKFVPNPIIKSRLEEMKSNKLSKFDTQTVKTALSATNDLEDQVIENLNLLDRFTGVEIKTLMRHNRSRNYLYCLMRGTVPCSGLEKIEIDLRTALYKLSVC